ncbi:hypothetical protein, partial [Streptomyces thioluteus]|uniref:hypothetical protein n=1 Tax=Streptomyces thioluteus TaxID=66431 RepID=UPI0031EA69DF
ISHRNASNTVQDINRRFGVGPGDRVLALAPTGFDSVGCTTSSASSARAARSSSPSPSGPNDPAHWTELIDGTGSPSGTACPRRCACGSRR